MSNLFVVFDAMSEEDKNKVRELTWDLIAKMNGQFNQEDLREMMYAAILIVENS